MATEDLEVLVAGASQSLNSASIPCVLWGHCLLQVFGVPSVVGSIDFVVPDGFLEAGAGVLAHAAQLKSLVPCSNPDGCLTSSPGRHTPPPASHCHLRGSEVTVGPYLQRDTLWFLPPLNSLSTSLLSPKPQQLPQYFVLASDQTALLPWRLGCGSGFFKSGQSHVVVPMAHVLLEAFMRLYARDVGTLIGSFAMSMIAYMEDVDDDGFLDVNQLPGFLKKLYCELRQGKQPVLQWTKDLKETLNVYDKAKERVSHSHDS